MTVGHKSHLSASFNISRNCSCTKLWRANRLLYRT